MKFRAILLVSILLLSSIAAGTSAAAVTPETADGAVDAPVEAGDAAAQTTGANASDGSNGSNASTDPEPVLLPPGATKDRPVDTSALPPVAGETGGPAASVSPTANLSTGTVRLFPTLTVEGQYAFREFTLRRTGDDGEIWVANDLSFPENDSRPTPEISEAQLDYLMGEFDGNIYPTESELFREPESRYGNQSELADGGQVPENYYRTGNESRTIILVDNIRDQNYVNESYPLYIAGFYSSQIENLTDRNVVTVDGYDWDNGTGTPESPWRPPNGSNASYQVEGTFAHEYQHLLHADQDPDEVSWVNEGLSDYAELAVGYGFPSGHASAYEELPSNSLTQWEDQGAINVLADYGAAFLFQLYGHQRYGDAFVRGAFEDTDTSIAGINDTLDRVGASENFTTLYQDFAAALVADGSADPPAPYSFERADLEVNTSDEVLYTRDDLTAAWGNAYETIDASGDATPENVTVSGIDALPTRWETAENPVDPNGTVLASGAGNLVDEFAIFEADLSGTSSPTLGFDTYYNIERGWDYGYVQVSTDGGETWESLSNEHTTDYLAAPDSAYPPVVENLPGFTGDTDGEWTEQSFDLSAYAGEDVLIAFRYVGDYAVQGNTTELPGTGMYVRDVAVPGTNVSYDGSSVDPFRGIDEVRGEYVDYQYSVLGLNEAGDVVDVRQYPVKTFADEESHTLTGLPTGEDVSRLLLTVTRASDQGDFGTVPYDYTVGYAGEGPTEPPASDNATNYQVDFVAGEPYDRIGGEYPLYAEEDRLFRFAFGNADEGITQRGSAWASEDLRECVDYGHITEHDDGTASVSFTVADDCANVTLSLAVYEKPGDAFDASATQTLTAATTGTFGPGTHTVTVDLPGGDGEGGA